MIEHPLCDWEVAGSIPGQVIPKTSKMVLAQGSYMSGKCQGNLNFFKVRELSGNSVMCQGKMKFCKNVREFYIPA